MTNRKLHMLATRDSAFI